MGDWFTGLPVMEKGGTGMRTGSEWTRRCRPRWPLPKSFSRSTILTRFLNFETLRYKWVIFLSLLEYFISTFLENNVGQKKPWDNITVNKKFRKSFFQFILRIISIYLKNIEPLCLPRNISSTSSTICKFDGKSKPGGPGKL